YRSAVRCRRTTSRPSTRRSGTVYRRLRLRPGEQATCTFYNVRSRTPAIAIEKTGPRIATAGDTLHYELLVTNPGEVPLRASTIRVTDDACDHAPVLVSKGGDRSPRTLDPGDSWTYACSDRTVEPGEDCEASVVRNTATASSGSLVDDDTIGTT